jgi:hypothetical protein
VHAFVDIPQGPVSQEKKKQDETEKDQSRQIDHLPLPAVSKRRILRADTLIVWTD